MRSNRNQKRVHVATRRTLLIAVDLIGAVVVAVIEVVATEDGADAAPAGALELIFLAHGYRRRHFWKQAQARAVFALAFYR